MIVNVPRKSARAVTRRTWLGGGLRDHRQQPEIAQSRSRPGRQHLSTGSMRVVKVDASGAGIDAPSLAPWRGILGCPRLSGPEWDTALPDRPTKSACQRRPDAR